MKLGQVFLVLLGIGLAASQYPEFLDTGEDDVPRPAGYAGSDTAVECRYDEAPFSDCDPIQLSRWRVQHLVSQGPTCEEVKNETTACSSDEFPPGTQWLAGEHKKCLSELEHLKGLMADLHRWIDVIHERGQALFSAFNDLRKHLEDMQRQLKQMHRQMHDNDVLMERLVKELDTWKQEARNFRGELDSLKAKYGQLMKEHEQMKLEVAACEKSRDSCRQEVAKLSEEIRKTEAENRELKAQLMEAERYKLLLENARKRLTTLQSLIVTLTKELANKKYEMQKCQVDTMNESNKKDLTVDRDTHVNLDMTMYITHNETTEEGPKYATQTYPPSPSYATSARPPQRIYQETTYPQSTYGVHRDYTNYSTATTAGPTTSTSSPPYSGVTSTAPDHYATSSYVPKTTRERSAYKPPSYAEANKRY